MFRGVTLAATSFFGSIPAVGKVKKAGKALSKKIAKFQKHTKNKLKKLKKKRKRTIGKVYTKARKLRNTLKKRQLVRRVKKVGKKVILAAKKTVQKVKKQVKQVTKQAVKQVKVAIKQANVKAKQPKAPAKVKQSNAPPNRIEGEEALKEFFATYGQDRGPIGADGERLFTLESQRRVVSKPSDVKPDGLAPYAIAGYHLFVEDFVTLVDPQASTGERIEAFAMALPAGKLMKVPKGGKILGSLDELQKIQQAMNKTGASSISKKETEQLAEYVQKITKNEPNGSNKAPVGGNSATKVDKGTGNNVSPKIESLDASKIRFSQTSVNGSEEIINSMKANGWKGDPIDVVKMPDGNYTTIDNTRVAAAREAGINVKALIRDFNEPLPSNMIDRFTTKKGVPETWGEALELRVQKQKASFRNNNPMGSYELEKMK